LPQKLTTNPPNKSQARGIWLLSFCGATILHPKAKREPAMILKIYGHAQTPLR